MKMMVMITLLGAANIALADAAFLDLINKSLTLTPEERTSLCVQLVTDIRRDTGAKAAMQLDIAMTKGAVMSDTGYLNFDVFEQFTALSNRLTAENAVYGEHCQ